MSPNALQKLQNAVDDGMSSEISRAAEQEQHHQEALLQEILQN